MSVPLRRCPNCDTVNAATAKFCSECGADVQNASAAPAATPPAAPPFTQVLGTVWKVLMALLLIPFLLLLGSIALSMIGSENAGTAFTVTVLVALFAFVVWSRRRSGVG